MTLGQLGAKGGFTPFSAFQLAGDTEVHMQSAIDFPWDYAHVTADTEVKTVPCVLHSIVVNGLTTAGDATIYDNTEASGDVIGVLHLDVTTSISVQPITLLYDVRCKTGLYIAFDQSLAADLTVSYK